MKSSSIDEQHLDSILGVNGKVLRRAMQAQAQANAWRMHARA